VQINELDSRTIRLMTSDYDSSLYSGLTHSSLTKRRLLFLGEFSTIADLITRANTLNPDIELVVAENDLPDHSWGQNSQKGYSLFGLIQCQNDRAGTL
jgi:hypothetical protein